MRTRAASLAFLCSLLWASAAQALTDQELIAKLETAGYSQIREIKSTPEGTSVKATKNGQEVSIVVDSNGQIKERK
jgi:hypothetical protein